MGHRMGGEAGDRRKKSVFASRGWGWRGWNGVGGCGRWVNEESFSFVAYGENIGLWRAGK